VRVTGDEEDLRPSETKWLGDRLTEAADAAKVAVIATVVDMYGQQLPRLLPSANDPAVPAHDAPLEWLQGSLDGLYGSEPEPETRSVRRVG
jgi:hypothetical protein